MRKQILAVMVGLTVILGGCSKQSAQNTESTDSKQNVENIENILQEVKKDTREAKSGKVTISLLIDDEKDNPSRSSGYERSGDEKFDQLEFAMKGKILGSSREEKDEFYLKDSTYYIKAGEGDKAIWTKQKLPKNTANGFNFKKESLNMQDEILNLLDNKDNWDVINDGDKVTFKLKKTDEMKNKVKEAYLTRYKEEIKFSEFDYNIEYVFNTKNKDVEKLAYELTTKNEGLTQRVTTKGSLEEINKEVKVELPEESKNADEFKS